MNPLQAHCCQPCNNFRCVKKLCIYLMQSISNLLGQFVTSSMQSPTLLQDANKLLQICQQLETINTDLVLHAAHIKMHNLLQIRNSVVPM